MIERFFTQSSWLGVSFNELPVQLDPNSPASSEFYRAFYDFLEQRYTHYSDFPPDWLHTKAQTARLIAATIGNRTPMLSYGCGIGVVEHFLRSPGGLSDLRLYDFARNAAYFDHEMSRLYLSPEDMAVLGSTLTFGSLYFGQVLYALDAAEALALLTAARTWVFHDGVLLSVDTSANPTENGAAANPVRSLPLRPALAEGRRVLRGVRRRATRLFARDDALSSQGWGWERDNASMASILAEAGWLDVQHFSGAGQSFTIARSPSSTT